MGARLAGLHGLRRRFHSGADIPQPSGRRFGGAKVALFFALVEAAGQALIWLAVRPEMALGAGPRSPDSASRWSIPGFGVEAVRRVPAQSRGLAMGAYTAFLDLAQGIASPALGLIAKRRNAERRVSRQCRHRALRCARRVLADDASCDRGGYPQ